MPMKWLGSFLQFGARRRDNLTGRDVSSLMLKKLGRLTRLKNEVFILGSDKSQSKLVCHSYILFRQIVGLIFVFTSVLNKI